MNRSGSTAFSRKKKKRVLLVISCRARLPLIMLITLIIAWQFFSVSDAVAKRLESTLDQVSLEKRYPANRYMVGSACVSIPEGGAVDPGAADRAARAELAKQIEVKIEQSVKSIQAEEARDDQISSSYAVEIQSKELVGQTLKGVKIVEQYTYPSEGAQCAVAVIDKIVTGQRLQAELESLTREAKEYQASAEETAGRGDTVQALQWMTMAMLTMDKAALSGKMLQALGHRSPGLPLRTAIRNQWIDLLKTIYLMTETGNLQRGKPGSPLPAPLTIKALDADKRPVKGLPIKVLRSPEGGEIQATAMTDADGRAKIAVKRLPSGLLSASVGQIAVGIDWIRLLAETGLDVSSIAEAGRPALSWDTREILFTYRVPVPSEFRVGVALFEQESGQGLPTSPIESAILKKLQSLGFKTADSRILAQSIPTGLKIKPDLKTVQENLLGQIDILILGDVPARPASVEDHGFFLCQVRGTLQAINMKTGRLITTVDLEAKGRAPEEAQAVDKAMSSLSKRLSREAAFRLEESLE